MEEADPRRYGISREEVRRGERIVRVAGPCTGCGSRDHTHVKLQSHPSLPKGSCVPLGPGCKPHIF